jgi:hypothetical protein
MSKIQQILNAYIDNLLKKTFEEHTIKRFNTLKKYLKNISDLEEEQLKYKNIVFIPSSKKKQFPNKNYILTSIYELLNGNFSKKNYDATEIKENNELRGGDLIIMGYIAKIMMHELAESKQYFGVCEQYKSYIDLLSPLTDNEKKFREYISNIQKNIPYETYKLFFMNCFDISENDIRNKNR